MNKQRELLERSLEVIKLFVPSYGLLIEEIEAELAKPEQEPVSYEKLNALIESLRPIVSAAEANDSDTLCSLLTDDTIIWTAVGSWCAPSTITLGDLRNIVKYSRVTNLYTSPPQYKPFSDDEIVRLLPGRPAIDTFTGLFIVNQQWLIDFAHNIEKRITEGKP